MSNALIAIVGRPNVGKSTLFNRIVGAKKAIVFDQPGVTRDRHYGIANWAGPSFDVVDTGGFEPTAQEGILAKMRNQAMLAIEEADLVVFVVDARSGLIPADQEVADILRKSNRPVICAVNKIDGDRQEMHMHEFHTMGLDEIFPVSAEHGRGVSDLLERIAELLKLEEDDLEAEAEDELRVALFGRPNVGKSTLVNRLLGEDRMIVDSTAGTTRDSIDSVIYDEGQRIVLIDTAGLRRQRGIIANSSEGYSVMRTLRSIERCHVALVLIDGVEGITDQDAKIIGLTYEKGRALMILINKWDAVDKDDKTAQMVEEQIKLKLPFAAYAPVIFISGLTGQRVHKLLPTIKEVRQQHLFRASTGPLNRWLEDCLHKHHPPTNKGRRLRLYYVTQSRTAPPTLTFHCNHPDLVHFSYKRFLINQFIETFQLVGTPVKMIFKGKDNPYVEDEKH
jgi:GTP-binding protein